MGISDRLKDLKTKATEAAVERSDQIHGAVEKVATTANQRTGGKYSERIHKAGAKADGFVESLKGSDRAEAQEAAPAPAADAAAVPIEGAAAAPAEAPGAPGAQGGEDPPK